jgi:hypothetical protein
VGYIHKIERNTGTWNYLPSPKDGILGVRFHEYFNTWCWALAIINNTYVSDLAATAGATPLFATTSFEKGEKPLHLLLTYLLIYLPTYVCCSLVKRNSASGEGEGGSWLHWPQASSPPVSSIGRKCESPLLSHPSNPLPSPHLVATSSFLAFFWLALQHPPGLSGRRFHNKDPSSLAAFTTFLSHRISSLLLLLAGGSATIARAPASSLALSVVFLGFFGQYRVPPRGRAVFLYLSSNSLLSSLSLPSHIWLAPWWFGFGFVRCSTRDWSDLCWRAEEAAPKIRRSVRFWTMVDILLKAVCLSSFPCPLLFFFSFLGLVTSARAVVLLLQQLSLRSRTM